MKTKHIESKTGPGTFEVDYFEFSCIDHHSKIELHTIKPLLNGHPSTTARIFRFIETKADKGIWL